LAADAYKRRHRPSLRREGALALAVIAAGAGSSFAAKSISQSFGVTVTLKSAQDVPVANCANVLDPLTNKLSIGCIGGQTGTTTVFRTEPPPYLLHVYRPGEWLVDDQMGNGTLTSWRIVHVANREYLEMMVGW